MKTCKECGEDKPIEDFPTYKRGTLVRSICKVCNQRRNRDWRRSNLHCKGCSRYRPRRMFYVAQGIEAVLCSECREGKGNNRGPHNRNDEIHEEFDFARSVLGKTHESAWDWVKEQFGISGETMQRAGLYRAQRVTSPTDIEVEDVELRSCKACGSLKTLDQMGKTMQWGKRYYRHTCNTCLSHAAKVKRRQRAAAQGRTIRPRRIREA